MGQRSDSAYSVALLISFIIFSGVTTLNDQPQGFNKLDPYIPDPIPDESEFLTDVNLAPMFQGGTGQLDGCRWGQYNLFGFVAYASTDPADQIAIRDDTVTYNGHSSIRVEPHTSADPNSGREVDMPWISVSPSDHIVFRVYAKTGSHANPTIYTGARAGIDFYCGSPPVGGGTGVVDGQPHGYYVVDGVWKSNGHANYVAGAWDYINYQTFVDVPVDKFKLPWGNGTWTMLEWDVYVPTQVYTQNFEAVPIAPQQISGIMAWVDAREVTDEAYAYFADAELYKNPSDTFVEQVQTPTFSPIAGVYGATQTVTISSATPSASIYYTNNGSTPTSASNEYTVPLSIAETTTLKALATKSAYTDSSVGTALYTINNPVTPSAAAARAYMAMLRRR